jgi:hypothetical protein
MVMVGPEGEGAGSPPSPLPEPPPPEPPPLPEPPPPGLLGQTKELKLSGRQTNMRRSLASEFCLLLAPFVDLSFGFEVRHTNMLPHRALCSCQAGVKRESFESKEEARVSMFGRRRSLMNSGRQEVIPKVSEK